MLYKVCVSHDLCRCTIGLSISPDATSKGLVAVIRIDHPHKFQKGAGGIFYKEVYQDGRR